MIITSKGIDFVQNHIGYFGKTSSLLNKLVISVKQPLTSVEQTFTRDCIFLRSCQHRNYTSNYFLTIIL